MDKKESKRAEIVQKWPEIGRQESRQWRVVMIMNK